MTAEIIEGRPMPSEAATPQQPLEPFGIAIARRSLTQTTRFNASATPQMLSESARGLQADIANLATGLDLQRSAATRALVAQQIIVADDIATLFPHDSQMALTADQFRAKADNGQRVERDAPRA
jgi:hypothetical protein